MRQIFVALFIISLSFVSCEKATSCEEVPETVKVKFEIDSATKSVSDIDKDRIETIDVFVFVPGTGQMITYDHMQGNAISLYLQRGLLRDYYFFANAPEGVFDEVRCLSDLLNLISGLEDNRRVFVMHAHTSLTFMADSELKIEVSRLCSKIVIDKIVPKFMESNLTEYEVMLKRVFLMNVGSEMDYSGNLVDSKTFYNVSGYDPSLSNDLKSLISYEMNRPIYDASVIEDDVFVYCYTRDTKKDSISNTKLVLEVEIAGISNYYTMQLPRLEPNHEYFIETIRLLGFGSAEPGDNIDRIEVSFDLDINDWGEANENDTVME